jgi:hypothetical protein
MKRKLGLVCAAAIFTACRALAVPQAPAALSSRGSAQAFSYITESSLFGACLQAVQLAKAPGVSFSKSCADAFGKSGAQAAFVSMDCAELAGRASEASDEGFLGDGRLLCGRLARERSVAASRPLAAFAPVEGSAAASVFCDVMRSEALDFCMTSSASAVVATPAVVPVVAEVSAQTQATPALRAAEAKLVRLATVPPAPQQPQQQQQQAAMPQQPMGQPVERLLPPKMDEAAQTIAAGVWPSFSRQVSSALAAGPAGLPAPPMNAKAEQQPDLNNSGIWTNLAALLHRTG